MKKSLLIFVISILSLSNAFCQLTEVDFQKDVGGVEIKSVSCEERKGSTVTISNYNDFNVTVKVEAKYNDDSYKVRAFVIKANTEKTILNCLNQSIGSCMSYSNMEDRDNCHFFSYMTRFVVMKLTTSNN